jgi:hypothetical protein
VLRLLLRTRRELVYYDNNRPREERLARGERRWDRCCAGTKASQIRLMATHGLGVTLMAKVLGTTYQQVYQTARYQETSDVDVPESEACKVCFRHKHK